MIGRYSEIVVISLIMDLKGPFAVKIFGDGTNRQNCKSYHSLHVTEWRVSAGGCKSPLKQVPTLYNLFSLRATAQVCFMVEERCDCLVDSL